MIDVITYKKIVDSVNFIDTSRPVKMCFTDSIDPVSRNAMAKINTKIKGRKLVGVMFCNPHSKYCQNEILNHLNYFHHRSGENINFFCCGYGADWPDDKFPDQVVVTTVDGAEWSYSDQSLVSIISEFERKTEWRYSGENELLLLDVGPGSNDNIKINNAIVCNLEKMQKDSAFTSVRAFFEKIIRYTNDNNDPSAWGYSDSQGLNIAKEWLKDAVLGLLPKTLASTYKATENYAIKKI